MSVGVGGIEAERRSKVVLACVPLPLERIQCPQMVVRAEVEGINGQHVFKPLACPAVIVVLDRDAAQQILRECVIRRDGECGLQFSRGFVQFPHLKKA